MGVFKALLNDLDWRPIDEYSQAEHGAVLLAGSRGLLIGELADGIWCQLLDGDLIPLERFKPDHFAVPGEEIIAGLTLL